MSQLRRLSAATMLCLLILGLAPVEIKGYHSLNSPIAFYDANDNGVPGPDPDFDHEGPYSSTNHLNRLNEAVVSWSANTKWDPSVANTSQNIFVDGRIPYCVDEWLPGDLAFTCWRINVRTGHPTWGTYWQIYDTDIYMHMEIASAPDWWVGAGVPPQSDRFDFGGALTHELGHTAGLDHYTSTCTHSSSAWVTMCPSVADNLESYWMRSLHADDKDSVDDVYPSVILW